MKDKIKKEIESIRNKIYDLESKEIELCKKYILSKGNGERYDEKKRTIGRGKNKRTFLEGRFYWVESFIDADTDRVICVERSRAVKENDIWDDIAITSLII